MNELDLRELVDAQYYCRETQVNLIYRDFCDNYSEDPDTHLLLKIAFMTPKIFFDLMVKQSGLDKEDFFDRIKRAAMLDFSHSTTVDILGLLRNSCTNESRQITESAIDSIGFVVPQAYSALFADHKDILEEARDLGIKQGVINALKAVEGDIPLGVYRRDLLQRKITLSPGFRAEIGSLSTKIPNVDLRLAFANGSQMPVASFVIKPF